MSDTEGPRVANLIAPEGGARDWGDSSLDGNAAAGALLAVLGVELTAAAGTCDHCGTESVVATLRAYVGGPGIVLRCPACAGVVIRLVERPDGAALDVSGLRLLRLEATG